MKNPIIKLLLPSLAASLFLLTGSGFAKGVSLPNNTGGDALGPGWVAGVFTGVLTQKKQYNITCMLSLKGQPSSTSTFTVNLLAYSGGSFESGPIFVNGTKGIRRVSGPAKAGINNKVVIEKFSRIGAVNVDIQNNTNLNMRITSCTAELAK